MNRYSLVFALLIASSFVVQAPVSQKGVATETSAISAKHRNSNTAKKTTYGQPVEGENTPDQFVRDFLSRGIRTQTGLPTPEVLFVTVPHPVETHLAASFDLNLEALQNGLAESRFLFDSAWVPWTRHPERDRFDDEQQEKRAEEAEDTYPGILLFRNGKSEDPYQSGLIVFLISEKPTEGLALTQVTNAWAILADNKVGIGQRIKILGPNFSGSFATLTSMVRFLNQKAPNADFLIRSGGVTVGTEAAEAGRRMSSLLGSRHVDFGSALHNYDRWIDAIGAELSQIGIDPEQVAILSEGESLYGSYPIQNRESTPPWKLVFPRDISSLRAGYDNQGILRSLLPAQPWNKTLNLDTDDAGDGDTIKSFGGSSSLALQEGILLGISGFIKTHPIRAVVISATNPEDSYFLVQFLHAHNSNVRVAVLGSSRLFLRNSTAQFRGDMIVDDFPMLPTLPDWTGAQSGSVVRIFADDVAEGIFFASLDLFEARDQLPQWLPEYSSPLWSESWRTSYPPMFVVAVGNSTNWPLYENAWSPYRPADSGAWQVSMPFELAGSMKQPPGHGSPPAESFRPGRLWYWATFGLVLLTLIYCLCFWIADPVSRVICASFQPASPWRFWMLCVIIPGGISAWAFNVLAWSAEFPGQAPSRAAAIWMCAEVCAILAPLFIAISAISKGMLVVRLEWNHWMTASFIPFAISISNAVFQGLLWGKPFVSRNFSSLANTYREMHFESGLSLVPTLLLFLLAFFVWARQASSGEALLNAAPPLPRIPESARISRTRGDLIVRLSKPIPPFRDGRSIWVLWIMLALIALLLHESRSLKLVTTLETYAMTQYVRWISFAVVCLILFDLVQFLNVWNELRGLLRALRRERFKRSFVPIDEFTWPTLWSFNGASFRDRRAIDAALSDSLFELADAIEQSEIRNAAKRIAEIWASYNRHFPKKVTPSKFAQDRFSFFLHVSRAANKAASLLDQQKGATIQPISPDTAELCRAVASLQNDKAPYREEREEVKLLPVWQRAAEKLICLMYVGFVQAIIARLHSLLVSIASMFSLLVLGFAIYPFVPFTPLMLIGTTLLIIIGWTFYKVFSELDTDPILSRIVNGDDRKLQSNFYVKLSESLALPLLTLASTILPGGAGRILEIAQTLVNHGQ